MTGEGRGDKFCVVYFSQFYNKTLGTSDLKEGCVWVQSLRCSPRARKVRQQEWEAGHVTHAVRTQREMNADTQPASFYFLFPLGPQPILTGTIRTQDGPSLVF